jgi:hypothetical protein
MRALNLSVKSRRFLGHGVAEYAYAGYLDFDDVADVEEFGDRFHGESDACGGAGGDKIAGFKRHDTAKVMHNLEYVEHHVAGGGVLS